MNKTLQPELMSNERLLWGGQPRPGWRLKPGDKMRLPVSVLFTLFVIYWTWQATTFTTPPNLWVMGVPFIFFGLYVSVGRYWIEAQQRNYTSYGITNQRVIIVCEWPFRRVTSILIHDIDHIFMDENTHNIGSIIFGMNVKTSTPFLPQRPKPKRFTPSFEAIPNVKQVYALIQSLQK
jgi:hypothetical protein